jgi:hypothetical protein
MTHVSGAEIQYQILMGVLRCTSEFLYFHNFLAWLHSLFLTTLVLIRAHVVLTYVGPQGSPWYSWLSFLSKGLLIVIMLIELPFCSDAMDKA